ncbi:hypothetical protein [Microbacterium sp. H1-D42]|uniref:hypothetical protein n=1 Tax=Microbacterium sp. H1-D42 TaxID=2925844 RepID=UPI001F537A41|nr:hypothetical protein [Microbacterium sp. H1-D42]UNK70906.1 hypothetical protein MNR00_00235 [Microbacterium sp. H1-D42]
MRIVVSGTHASGKSTLISDFAFRHPQFAVLGDPFDSTDERSDQPSAALFAAQLALAADRLAEEDVRDLIAERGPLDFLAYLLALAEITGGDLAVGFIEQATAVTAQSLRSVDLLVVLPLSASDLIPLGDDEHLELRRAMNDVLLDLLDDPEVVPPELEVIEITGDPGARLAALERYV